MIDKLLFGFVAVVLTVLCCVEAGCSGSVDVHGVPDQIELTGCGSALPAPGKDAGHD